MRKRCKFLRSSAFAYIEADSDQDLFDLMDCLSDLTGDEHRIVTKSLISDGKVRALISSTTKDFKPLKVRHILQLIGNAGEWDQDA